MKKKSYVVVGGSSGIGWSLLQQLSAAGAQVYHYSRSASLPADIAGVKHHPYDVCSDLFPTETLPEQIDGLVYCPGTIKLVPFSRLTANDFNKDYTLNLLGAVAAIQACLKPMRKTKTGVSIVLFSSVAAQTGMPFHALTASSKAAVEGLTRSLAAELAPGIRVNAVAPSLTDTPLAAGLLADEQKRKAAADRHPLKRIGTPDDISATVMFLLSDTSAWMTGQILHPDGGMGDLRLFR
ncbi:SDR family oxidoreductase [Desulfogranum marinum]|uniref:SDR family NAD(P)-dependent oxidoreductase n=1 Tax=Desulfogranum marinum TaxID=453220 RepID=UPI0029C60335|nr:SDR family oxidoreductase [Desulfogranum marinum]